jgi:hypothetical protein
MCRWAIALMIVASLLAGCVVGLRDGGGRGGQYYHHHDWR